MHADTILAVLHHLLFFSVFAVLTTQRTLLSGPLTAPAVDRIARADLFYGAAAGLLVAVGVARVVWGAKGAAFYTGNLFFWLKMAGFATAGLLSALPTVRYVRWRKALRAQPDAAPDGAAVGAVKRLVDVQLTLLLLLTVFAALMARGYGRL